MDNNRGTYQKHFGLGLNQDPFKAIAIRAYCGAVNGFDKTGVGFKAIDPEMMKTYLDDDDYKRWMALREEWESSRITA